ncbi:MAG: hypothetical protein BMS9Abin12_0929 [Acidimicrobiia bacterium]|nr:MAG: hypothetical protein BMS9Abin12_0929 [Acidimicrobiia bacterium]
MVEMPVRGLLMSTSYRASYAAMTGSVPAMRWITTTIVITLLAAACSSTGADAATSTTEPAQGGGGDATASIQVPPQIAGRDVQSVQVGDRMLLLAIADNPGLRRQGLQRVADLEDLDGMLFFWRHDGDAFWMKDTLIPLDIVWFNEDGTYKDRASMVPCTEDPCRRYSPEDGLDFRFAIEANPGDLDFIDEATVIIYSD